MQTKIILSSTQTCQCRRCHSILPIGSTHLFILEPISDAANNFLYYDYLPRCQKCSWNGVDIPYVTTQCPVLIGNNNNIIHIFVKSIEGINNLLQTLNHYLDELSTQSNQEATINHIQSHIDTITQTYLSTTDPTTITNFNYRLALDPNIDVDAFLKEKASHYYRR